MKPHSLRKDELERMKLRTLLNENLHAFELQQWKALWNSEGALWSAKDCCKDKSTEIMLIFFGIHTANVVNLARRESVQVALAA